MLTTRARALSESPWASADVIVPRDMPVQRKDLMDMCKQLEWAFSISEALETGLQLAPRREKLRNVPVILEWCPLEEISEIRLAVRLEWAPSKLLAQ